MTNFEYLDAKYKRKRNTKYQQTRTSEITHYK